jgi:hypothetical protein
MTNIFSSTARAQSTMSAVKDYWANYPDRVQRALRPPPRASAAREMFPHLSASPTPSSAPATAPRPVAAPARTHSPVRAVGSRSSFSMVASGSFFSEREAARGAVSPLDGRVKGGW